MVYNEIIIVPIDIMRRNTTPYRTSREGNNRGFGDDDDDDARDPMYVATSPQAAYDQGRNVRNIEKKLKNRDQLVSKH